MRASFLIISMSKETENPAPESPTRDWRDLTHVCLVNIFSRVSDEDRWKSAMFVSRTWLHAAKDRSFFSVFDLEKKFDELGNESSAWWTPEFEGKIDSMMRSAADWSDGELKEVCVRHCSDQALSFVAERSPNLLVLSIKSCPSVSDVSISKIAFGCPLLRELDISYCYKISYKSLELIGRKCPNLKVFKRNHMNWLDQSQYLGIVPSEYLNAFPEDGDREVSVIAMYFRNLDHLELRYSKMSANGLSLIAEGCGNLRHLDLFGCANLTSRAIEHAFARLKNVSTFARPNFNIRTSVFPEERYGHWRLYDERFQTNAFF